MRAAIRSRDREGANNWSRVGVQSLDIRVVIVEHIGSERIEIAKQMLREKVSFYDKDRYFAPDIEQANTLLKLAKFVTRGASEAQ